MTGQAAWRWRRWEVAANQLTPLDGLAPSTADTLWFGLDGRIYGSETTADYAKTTLIELSATGGPRPALTTLGFLSGLVKLR